MSVEDDVLSEVKANLDNKITELTAEISFIQDAINRREPEIAEINTHLDDLKTTNRQDRRKVENLQERVTRITTLRNRLESGEVEIEIKKRR